MTDATVAAEAVLRSAEEAFSRVTSGVREQVETMPPDLEPADALRWAGDRVTELLAGLADLPLDRLLGRPEPPATESAPRGDPIVVCGARGSVVEARVWVHPIGRLPATTLRFALSDLVGPDGTAWAAAEAVFAPAELALPGLAAPSTVLRLRLPDLAAPGEHHGLIIGRGAAGAVVPITLVIT